PLPSAALSLVDARRVTKTYHAGSVAVPALVDVDLEATRIASWDPNDSLSVECQHPKRCSWCPYQGLCERFR
ncbi:MAG: hypothetical protein ACREMZ_17160, partial [Gemmatimonadales bacterium]